ncbi:MAG: hypothetical protein AB1742_15150 [bacterium]
MVKILVIDDEPDCFMPVQPGVEKPAGRVEEIPAGGRVRARVRRVAKPVLKTGRKPATLLASAAFFFVFFTGLLWLFYFDGADFVETVQPSSADGDGEISAMADRLFIFTLPVVVGIMAYVAFVLKTIAGKEFPLERPAVERKIPKVRKR